MSRRQEAAVPAGLRAAAGAAIDELERVERTASPSLHWLQGTLGSGLLAAGLWYGSVGGGTTAEEGLARTAVMVGSHSYINGVRELLTTALAGGGNDDGGHQTGAAAAAAIGAWAGLMAGTALYGSTFRPAQYSGLIVYHAAVMAASACLRRSYQLECQRSIAASGSAARSRNYAWALSCAAVLACASIAAGGSFWLTSRGSSVGALAAGGAGFHAIFGACLTMGLLQARLRPHRPLSGDVP